jgi:Na+-translocating ferredoxin:NAD+ oxidoreductase subunit G
MSDNYFRYLAFITPAAISLSAYAVDYLSVDQAQKVLFPKATQFVKKDVTLTDSQLSKIKELSNVRQRNKSPEIWNVKAADKIIGHFFVDEVIGKHEFITYAVGVTPEGEVIGVEIMSYRETHGGQVREENWRNNFKGKKLSDPFKLDKDVPNITGATLSCRNVLDGVKRILSLRQVLSDEKPL